MWIGDGLNYACMFLIDTLGNWSVVALYAALQPLLIVFGAANFTMPISLNSVTTLGYDPILWALQQYLILQFVVQCLDIS